MVLRIVGDRRSALLIAGRTMASASRRRVQAEAPRRHGSCHQRAARTSTSFEPHAPRPWARRSSATTRRTTRRARRARPHRGHAERYRALREHGGVDFGETELRLRPEHAPHRGRWSCARSRSRWCVAIRRSRAGSSASARRRRASRSGSSYDLDADDPDAQCRGVPRGEPDHGPRRRTDRCPHRGHDDVGVLPVARAHRRRCRRRIPPDDHRRPSCCRSRRRVATGPRSPRVSNCSTESSWSDPRRICDHPRMAIGITEEHEELRQAVRRFVDTNIPPAAARAVVDGATETRPAFWAALSRAGLARLHVAEAHGGAGYGLVEQAVVIEELGRACAPGPYLADRDRRRDPRGRGRRRRPRRGCRSSPSGECTGAVALSGARAGARRRTTPTWSCARSTATWYALDARRRARDGAAEHRPHPPRRGARPRRRAAARRSAARRAHDRAGARPRRGAARGRGGRRRAVVRRHRGRVREGARAVRPPDRPVPRREAPLRRHAGAHRARARGRVGRGPRRATTPDNGDGLAIAAAAALAFDAAFLNGKDCVQTLGGIGFTWEHDAHLYLRRAITLHQLVGHARRVARARRARSAGRRAPAARGRPRPGSRGAPRRGARAARRDQGPLAARAARAARATTATSRRAGRGRGAATPKALELLVIEEEFRAAKVPRANIGVGAWALPTLIVYGTPEQQERWILPTLRGEINWCQLFSEPGAGSDLASLSTRATRVEGGWVLNGQKVWTSMAQASRVGHLPRAHRARPSEARRHLVLHGRHEDAGHRHPAAARAHRQRDVQRGVLRRRVRARGLPRRRRARRLALRAHDARERARVHGRQQHDRRRRASARCARSRRAASPTTGSRSPRSATSR